MALVGTPMRTDAIPDFTQHLQFGEGSTIPVAWGDAEGDGDLDVAVGNYFGENNYLYRNDGANTFSQLNAFGQKSTFALVWGDYDNDGDLDVAVGNGQGQQNRLIVNNGDGTFSGHPEFGANATLAMAWADLDLDGDLDLAVGNGLHPGAQQNYLYVNDGAGGFSEQAQFGVNKTATLTWADFDDDGDPDLAVGNGGFGSEEQNYLYVNDGDGTFTERSEFGIGDTACLVWGDSDGDGDLDLAVANWNAGQNRLYVNNGDGSFTGLDRFGIRDPNTMAWGDFDNDGDLDLAVGNGDFGSADQNYLYVNEGGNTFTERAQFGLGSTDAVAWGDSDGDGDLDLAVGNEHSTTQNYLYVNNENDTDWLFLHLIGHVHDQGAGHSNRDGVGAKIAVYEAGFLGDPGHLLGFREIECHGGFAAQNAIDGHFGLPGRAAADVRITWPGSAGSNVVQDLTGVPVPGRFVIHEGQTATFAPEVGGDDGPLGIRVTPNPTRGPVVIELARPASAPRGAAIFDAAGHLVSRIDADSRSSTQLTRLTWNGRNRDGRAVSAGVYFVRILGTEKSAGARIVVLR
jgi:hypothetical protein